MIDNEGIESYENGLGLELYREYRDVVPLSNYVVETNWRFYLASKANVTTHNNIDGDVFFGIELEDTWVRDVYHSSCFAQGVKVLSFKDVNTEELSKPEIEVPNQLTGASLLASQVGVGGGVGGVDGIAAVFWSG